MLALYGDVLLRATRHCFRSWPALLSLFVYTGIMFAGGTLSASLGPLGWIIMLILTLACIAGYLNVLGDTVTGSRVRWKDLRRGMRGLWSMCGVSFALWIMGLVVGMIISAAGPNAPRMAGIVALAGAVFLNALPEVFYLGGHGGFSALRGSVQFIVQHAFTWLLPNILFGLVLIACTGALWVDNPGEILLRLSELAEPSTVAAHIAAAPLWIIPVLVVFVHFFMVFRGILFQEINAGGDNPRLRAFRASLR